MAGLGSFWGTAGGWDSPAKYRRKQRAEAAARHARIGQERERITRLSDRDIRAIMVRVIAGNRQRSGVIEERLTIDRADFHRAGIPDSRIDANFEAALTLARQVNCRIDAMGALA